MNLYFLLLIIVILCCLNYKKADNYKLGSAASLPAPFMRPSGRIYWGERTLPKTFKEGAHWGWVPKSRAEAQPRTYYGPRSPDRYNCLRRNRRSGQAVMMCGDPDAKKGTAARCIRTVQQCRQFSGCGAHPSHCGTCMKRRMGRVARIINYGKYNYAPTVRRQINPKTFQGPSNADQRLCMGLGRYRTPCGDYKGSNAQRCTRTLAQCRNLSGCGSHVNHCGTCMRRNIKTIPWIKAQKPKPPWVPINVGASASNSKTVQFKRQFAHISPLPRNRRHPAWKDKFAIKLVNYGKAMEVRRTDARTGWRMPLILWGKLHPEHHHPHAHLKINPFLMRKIKKLEKKLDHIRRESKRKLLQGQNLITVDKLDMGKLSLDLFKWNKLNKTSPVDINLILGDNVKHPTRQTQVTVAPPQRPGKKVMPALMSPIQESKLKKKLAKLGVDAGDKVNIDDLGSAKNKDGNDGTGAGALDTTSKTYNYKGFPVFTEDEYPSPDTGDKHKYPKGVKAGKPPKKPDSKESPLNTQTPGSYNTADYDQKPDTGIQKAK